MAHREQRLRLAPPSFGSQVSSPLKGGWFRPFGISMLLGRARRWWEQGSVILSMQFHDWGSQRASVKCAALMKHPCMCPAEQGLPGLRVLMKCSWWSDDMVPSCILYSRGNWDWREASSSSSLYSLVGPRSELRHMTPIYGLSFRKANSLHVYSK